MASTVVGLFERRSDAEAALSELVSNSFDQGRIDTYEGSAASEVQGALAGHGVPEEDARLFTEGVRHGDTLEVAHTDDDRAELAREIMDRHGAIDIHDAFAQRGAFPLAGAGLAAAAVAAAPTARAEGDIVVPVVEEQLAVGKREIQRGGVRVFTRVEETPVEQSVTLREEHVSVERHAVDRPAVGDAGFKEADLVVTETSEVPVVAKETRVVEEVVVGKTATDRIETVRDTVRRTDVEVEEVVDGRKL